MDSGLIEAALWFGIGALAYRLVSYLVGYARIILLTQETVVNLLFMLRFYDRAFTEDKKVFKQYLVTEQKDALPENIDKVWDLTLELWRNQSIRAIKSRLPLKVRRAFRFNNWKEAMHFLNKFEQRM